LPRLLLATVNVMMSVPPAAQMHLERSQSERERIDEVSESISLARTNHGPGNR
jgi:hypothetical protein